MPVPPDPITPGLLDLLTVVAIGEPPPAAEDRDEASPAPAPPVAAAFSGSRRLWVEVEV